MFKSVITPEMHYDDWARQYDKDMQGWGYHAPSYVFEKIKPFIASHKYPPRLLDVGIGTGILSAKCRTVCPDMHVTGVDISQKMLDVCEKHAVADNLERIDVSRDPFPFKDNSFDVVGASGLMENVENISHTIEEMVRVLRPGGLVVFTYMPAIRHPLREKMSKKLRPGRTREGRFVVGDLDLYRHNPDVIKQKARAAGALEQSIESFVGYRTYVVVTVDYELFSAQKIKGVQ